MISKCGLCDSQLEYYNHKGTHIQICEMCPNVQFEYYSQGDVKRVEEFLRERK